MSADSLLPPCVIVCGPTAAGKTGIALKLAEIFPARLISVDSVQVYRGMDVGSAKPDPATLGQFPHALIDIRDPGQRYSAADFVADAEAEICRAASQGKLPLLVGGTAMYLRALRWGLDRLPSADPGLRKHLIQQAAARGWPALHRRLARLDPAAAERISPNDAQRIQRALEICLLSDGPASRRSGRMPIDRLRASVSLVVAPADRRALHRRIDQRWSAMLEGGLIEEVRALLDSGLPAEDPVLRSVGYRQALAVVRGQMNDTDLALRGAAATRQLAKRQLTAFRQWTGGLWYDPLNPESIDRIIQRVGQFARLRE